MVHEGFDNFTPGNLPRESIIFNLLTTFSRLSVPFYAITSNGYERQTNKRYAHLQDLHTLLTQRPTKLSEL